jgi:hypothetical protein
MLVSSQLVGFGAAETAGGPVPVPSGLLGLLDERQGWGQDACDAAAGYGLYTVTSGSDDGVGTLRAALESADALWIVFDPLVTLVELDDRIFVQANKVIDGRGVYPTISAQGLGNQCLRLDCDDVIVTDVTIDGGITDWDEDAEAGDCLTTIGAWQRQFVQFCHFRRAGDGGWDTNIDGGGGYPQYLTMQNCLLTEIYQGFNHTSDYVSSLRNLFWNVRLRAMQMKTGKGYLAQCAIGGPAGESWTNAGVLHAQNDADIYSDHNAWRPDTEPNIGIANGTGTPKINYNGDIEFFGAATQTAAGTVNATFITDSRANWDRVAPADDFDRWNVIWRACGGGPRSAARSVYCAGKTSGTGTTIDLDALVSGGIRAGDVVVIGYKGETAGGQSGFSISGFTRVASTSSGDIRVMTFARRCDGTESTVSVAGATSTDWIATVWRSPGAVVASISPSSWQASNNAGNPAQITVSPGTTERLCMAIVTYGSDGAVNPRTSSITMAEQQGGTTDLYMKFMVWDARFNPPPASFTADMDDEGGGNVVQGGYLDIT